MSESNSQLTLEDVFAFNEQLSSLSRAGIEFDFPNAHDGKSLIKLLSGINEQTSSFVRSGDSVPQALAKCSRVREGYLTALQVWKHGSDPAAALGMLNSPAKMQAELAWNLRFSLVHLLVIVVLAYFGFLVIINSYSFVLEAIYKQLRLTPGPSLAITIFARAWLVLWGPLIPVAITGIVLLIRRLPANRLKQWFPLSGRAIDEADKAAMAVNLTKFLERDVSVDDAVRMLNPSESDSRLSSGSQAGPPLPSMIAWATSGDADRDSRIQMLQAIESIYQRSSSTRSTWLRTWIPQAITLALGGTIVLLFGLALFSPLIESLIRITQVRGVD